VVNQGGGERVLFHAYLVGFFFHVKSRVVSTAEYRRILIHNRKTGLNAQCYGLVDSNVVTA
jgi:hypothetical protein